MSPIMNQVNLKSSVKSSIQASKIKQMESKTGVRVIIRNTRKNWIGGAPIIKSRKVVY